MECIPSSAIAGIIYASGPAQPVLVLGVRGPKLAVMVTLYQMCDLMNVEFLPARWWMGLWCALFVEISGITDSGSPMLYATRYTEVFSRPSSA